MDFYKELLYLNDKEIEKLVESRIDYLEDDKEDADLIGYNADEDIRSNSLNIEGDELVYNYSTECFYSGFIKEGTKVVFGMQFDPFGHISNGGSYYYIDTYDYIYEFSKYIKQFEIENEYELFDYILDFLKNYYGYKSNVKREDMFKLICNENGFYKPTKEHGISWFKGKGNAECTEYSIMAQNILSVFGIESHLVIGNVKTGNNSECHAFNLVSLPDKDMLLDFANYTRVVDINFRTLCESPFIGDIERIDMELVENLVNNNAHLIFDDYSYFVLGDSLSKISPERKRDYYVDGEIYIDDYIKKNKCKEKVKY